MIIDDLITDRSRADVDRAKLLTQSTFSSMTAEEKVDFLAGLKGAYNATDINRVGEAIQYITDVLANAGYSVTVSPRQNWSTADIPTAEELADYLACVQTIRDALAVKPTTPSVPHDMERLTFTEANNIEKILADVYELINNMMQTAVYCGQPFCGQIWGDFT